MLLLTQLTDDNALMVQNWEGFTIEPMNLIDDTRLEFFHIGLFEVLSEPPCGKVLDFSNISFRCECGDEDCATYATVSDNGNVTISDNGKSLTAKIDPRYCSRIYEANEPA